MHSSGLWMPPPLSFGPQQLSDRFVWEEHRDCDIHLCHLSCWLWPLTCPQAKMRWHTCSRALKVETSEVVQTFSAASPTGRHGWPMCPRHRMFTQSVFFSTEGILCFQHLSVSEPYETAFRWICLLPSDLMYVLLCTYVNCRFNMAIQSMYCKHLLWLCHIFKFLHQVL